MAHVNADGVATHYLAEGAPVPADLPEGVRLVGPGAPAPAAAEASPGPVQAPVTPRRAKAAKAAKGPQEVKASGGISLPKLGARNG